MVLGAFGNDWQWVKTNLEDRPFRYGEFYVGEKIRDNVYTKRVVREWYGSTKGELSRFIANDCDAIISCLYEYLVSYEHDYPQKTHFVPLPIVPKTDVRVQPRTARQPVRFFLGIKRNLMEYKGTDIFYEALQRIKQQYPDHCEITVVEDLPFDEYVKQMQALEAMSRGLICIGGGEEENYAIINEHELRPIINILPNVESVYHALEQLIQHPERIPILQQQSIDYVKKHHDYINIARQYEQIYQALT